MIQNLKVKAIGIAFDVVTDLGIASCVVTLHDKDKDGRPKLTVRKYIVLGTEYHSVDHFNNDVMVNGIKVIGNYVQKVCDNNGWNCWSY